MYDPDKTILKALKQPKNKGIRVLVSQAGLQIVDLGVEAAGGWSAGKLLLEAAIRERGYVNYGEFPLDHFALPSVDVYYDDPVDTAIPEAEHQPGWISISLLPQALPMRRQQNCQRQSN